MPPKALELLFTSYQDRIVVNGCMTTLGAAIGEMRQKKPDCKLCYFELLPGEALNEFSLRATHRVVFCHKDDGAGGTMARHNLGWALPSKTHLTTVWHMRWATKDLLPVKPALHLCGTVQVGGPAPQGDLSFLKSRAFQF